MLIVISSERDIENESGILQELFKQGLTRFHLRKPEKNLDEMRAFLETIDSVCHRYIMLHSHHDLVEMYNLKGYHFQEKERLNAADSLTDWCSEKQQKGFTVSSSFHAPEDIEKDPIGYDYVLLSPVFSSISKKGYEGKGFDVTGIDKKVAGMGGISRDTVKQTSELGYGGVGVLGGVWNAPDPVRAFCEIRDEVNRFFHE